MSDTNQRGLWDIYDLNLLLGPINNEVRYLLFEICIRLLEDSSFQVIERSNTFNHLLGKVTPKRIPMTSEHADG